MLSLVMTLFGGGALGFIGHMFNWHGKVGSILKSVPPKAWYALAIAAALLGAFLFHQHRLHQHDKALVASTIAARDVAWKKAFDKEHAAALSWKGQADQLHAHIAADERKSHDQAVAANAAVANALRVRGPGAASAAHCGQGGHSGVAGAPVRPGQATPAAGAAAAQVPSGDWAAVPWGWLTQIAQEHDDLLADKKSTIDNDKKQREAWPNKP